ncbi:MAG: phosphate ABC transporter substrate-binding protein PstS [Limnochordales bacterium]|nr:phosphate ABC transporter substrate-binding protein PstS [Limnochordales bacterium]
MLSVPLLSVSGRRSLKVALASTIIGSVLATAASLTATTASAAQTVTLTGAGATFPQPIYEKWFAEYNRLHPEVRINYQGIGSGGGIRAIRGRQVDFGASDAFLTDAELKSMPAKILHIPTVAGAVVVIYNLPGNPKLQLTPDVLVDIFLGKITRWNDPRLAAINPGIKLPALPISVVHRSDGSGTTNIFTSYLSAVSPEWATKVGAGTSVNWPVEAAAGKGNPGVAAYVRQLPGAIGYVELAYAKQNNLPHAALQNAAGRFVTASLETTRAAMASANMPADFRTMIVNAPGPDAYPIAGFTWLLIYEKQTDPVKGKALVDVIKWALKNGDAAAESLDYVPLPDSLQEKVLQALDNVQF